MSIENTLEDIIDRLRQGRFPNEQAISQGIVLRLLQELGWNTWDTNLVWPEYQTGEGRSDFALCHPPSKPAIFIEVKHPGKAAKTDPSFLERCSRHPDSQGRKRRYIARTAEDLYPDRPDLRDFCEPLPDGWLVATNLNNRIKMIIIRLATEVAGLSFGEDVIVEF